MEVLLEVADRGSFTAAASSLSFTPSAVSQQMASLERDIGAKLFDRTSTGMRLTSAGTLLLARAREILAAVSEAERELGSMTEESADRLRLGSFPSATTTFVGVAVSRMRSKLPGVRFELIDAEPHESLARLAAGQLDLALTHKVDGLPDLNQVNGHRLVPDEDLHVIELFDEPYCVALRGDHRLAERAQLELEDLRGELLVGSPELCWPWGPELIRLCQARGFAPRLEPLYSGSGPSIQAMVAAGRGMTLVPRLANDSLQPGLVARRLVRGPARHVCIVRLARTRLTQAEEAFVEAIRETIEDFELDLLTTSTSLR